jgi:hypothetical protein
MLTIKCKKSYRKRDGNVGFIYIVNGEEKELAQYVTDTVKSGLAEEKFKTKDGIIYFSNRFVGPTAPLVKTEKGGYFPESTDFDAMISTQKQIHTTAALKEQAA